VRVTGVLLVGGASRRFGSPKALATYKGSNLAEHAWALLDWCDERLAVGKTVDAYTQALPFGVVDDGTSRRAAIFGLRAGLAAASNEVCLFLPVDVPLVTEPLLRALARSIAVSQTGPLPGAYRRAILAEVDVRIRAGNLSLRGLAQSVLELDASRFANANTPAQLARIAGAETPPGYPVRGVSRRTRTAAAARPNRSGSDAAARPMR
jgi:molybdopterin-guanine dinucleotide biosynthesis protein A